MMLAVDIQQLHYRYHAQAPGFSIDSWQLTQGEHCFVYGKSGSGKSTFLNLLATLIPNYSGHFSLLGQSINTLSSNKRDQFRAKHIGYVFQNLNLMPFLTVLQNLQLACHFAKKTIQTDRLHSYLELLDLPPQLLQKQAQQLSQGQQQRVAII